VATSEPGRALVIETGFVAPGREGTLGFFLRATNYLAVHMLGGVVLLRKSAQ